MPRPRRNDTQAFSKARHDLNNFVTPIAVVLQSGRAGDSVAHRRFHTFGNQITQLCKTICAPLPLASGGRQHIQTAAGILHDLLPHAEHLVDRHPELATFDTRAISPDNLMVARHLAAQIRDWDYTYHPQPQAVDANALVEDTLHMLEGNGVTVIRDFAQDARAHIDPILARRMLINAQKNIAEHTSWREPNVARLTCSTIALPRGHLAVKMVAHDVIPVDSAIVSAINAGVVQSRKRSGDHGYGVRVIHELAAAQDGTFKTYNRSGSFVSVFELPRIQLPAPRRSV